MSQNITPFTASPWGSSGTGKGIPTPWLDYATATVPDSHELVLWWAQYLWAQDGNFRSAMERVAAYFLTIVEFPDLDPSEESEWRDFFNTQFDYKSSLLDCAHDYLTYGNLFLGIYIPFRRFAVCQKCHSERPIQKVDYTLEFTSQPPYLLWRRKNVCPDCGDSRPYHVVDRPDNDLSKVKINKYAPNEIEIAQNRFSLRKDIYWKILEDDRRDIQNGARIHIDDTPMDVLETVSVGGKLRFEPDVILHVSEPCISGIRTRGWGIPRSIANFRTAWLQQLTNKADQAVVTDYTLGMRLISPSPTPGGTDPMQTQGMEGFVANVQSMIGEHRSNPTSYHTSPHPLNYQFLGGEGATLIPPDKLKFRHQEFLNQMGIPLELHQANLSVQAAPIALRLFESYWQAVPSFYNRVLNFVVETLTKRMNLKSTEVKMQKTTVVDDMSYKTLLLQLMGGNQLSPQTALEPLGIDAHAEARKVIKYQDYLSKLQGEQQEKEQKRQEMQSLKGAFDPPNMAQQQQQAQQGAQGAPAGAPQGGAPMGGTPGAQQQPTSLQELADQATQMAQQLVSLPDGERKQQLKMLREGNKQLHALVMSDLEQLRSQASSQGKQMLLQPPAGGQGAPAPQ